MLSASSLFNLIGYHDEMGLLKLSTA